MFKLMVVVLSVGLIDNNWLPNISVTKIVLASSVVVTTNVLLLGFGYKVTLASLL